MTDKQNICSGCHPSPMRKFIQFELWKDCNVGCSFCFNKNQPDIDKVTRLQSVIDFLDSNEVYDYNEIGFIGGEFFGGQLKDANVKKLWDIIMDKCCTLIKKGIFNQLDIMTSLIYNGSEFFQFLKYIDNRGCISNLFIGTSYDLEGRFQSDNALMLWQKNIIAIHKLFPPVQVHTQIILTQLFIEKVLSGEFDIKKFEQTYHTYIDYNIPHAGYSCPDKTTFNEQYCSNFLLKRKDFLEFLNKVVNEKLVDIDRLFATSLKANVISLIKDGKIHIINSEECDNICLPLGLDKKAGYIDSDIDIYHDICVYKKHKV